LAFAAAANFPRQALHARLLGFHHPSLQKTLRFESEWPDDFAGLVARLRLLSPPKA
jgi:23S rRNA pseudouridine1911/1915/1917 synthase